MISATNLIAACFVRFVVVLIFVMDATQRPHVHYHFSKSASAAGFCFAPSKQIACLGRKNIWKISDLPLVLLPPVPSSNVTWRTGKLDSANSNKMRIGIVGGGIAGVSLAHALVRRGLTDYVDITVFEGGMPDPIYEHDTRPAAEHWKAATARNGHSLVPGASFYVYSTPAEFKQVVTDTVEEWYWRKLEQILNIFGASSGIARRDRFDIVPPYFSVQLWNCLGPTATHAERMSFIRFGINYLYVVCFGGDPRRRGDALLDLSLSNRKIFDEELTKNPALKVTIGYSLGFISFFRSFQRASENIRECAERGIQADHLSWEESINFEPRIANIPVRPIFGVRRPDDCTANSNEFVRYWRNETRKSNVKYVAGRIETLERGGDYRFLVAFNPQAGLETNGAVGIEAFDILVLSAGIETPLLARQLGVGHRCPVYPLRGFSLTVFVDHDGQEIRNLLRQPFKIDAMYTASVSPYTARWVGFGEFAGYGHQPGEVKSSAPKVLARYAKALFPDAPDVNSEHALACYRSLSPDDIPLFGPVNELPGLYFHTGHGTLGWTTGLATGDLLAQQIMREISGNRDKALFFADGKIVDEKLYSLDRFL